MKASKRRTFGFEKALQIVRAMPKEHRSALIQCSMPFNPKPRQIVAKDA